MEGQRRHQFLEDNPAVVGADWFPPGEDCPELADLRAEHERLTALAAGELAAAGDVRRTRDRELEARRASHERAFLGEKQEQTPTVTVGEDAVADAAARADAARDALQTFAQQAIADVTERAPALLDELDDVVRQAEAKREEARAILAEADRLEWGTKRMRNWLARTTGRSPLGLYPFEQLPVPTPDPATQMTVADLHAAVNPPIGTVGESGFYFTDTVDDDLDEPAIVDLTEVGVDAD